MVCFTIANHCKLYRIVAFAAAALIVISGALRFTDRRDGVELANYLIPELKFSIWPS